MQDKMGKDTYQSGSEQYPKGGKQCGFDSYGTGFFKVGAEAAVKHDEDQTDGTDDFRKTVIIKGNMQYAIDTEAHAKSQKRQQGRYPQAKGQTMHQNADNDDNACQQ